MSPVGRARRTVGHLSPHFSVVAVHQRTTALSRLSLSLSFLPTTTTHPMTALPPALDFPAMELEILAKWKEEETFQTQDKLSLDRGDQVRCNSPFQFIIHSNHTNSSFTQINSHHTHIIQTGIHLLRWPSLRHRPPALRTHPRRHHQGHRHSLRRPHRTPRLPSGRLGLPRTARRVSSRSGLEHYAPRSGPRNGH